MPIDGAPEPNDESQRRSPLLLVANPGADVYGSDLQMVESVSAMLGAGWRVIVVLPEHGPLEAILAARGAEVEHLDVPVVRRSYLSPRGVVTLAFVAGRRHLAMIKYLRHRRPAVLYVNTTTIPWWSSAGRVAGVPVVCHIHEAENVDSRAVIGALTAPLFLAHRVIVISRAATTAMAAVWPSLTRRAELIYNGVPDRPSPSVARPGTLAGSAHLAVVARLSPRKGIDVAIEATRLLRRRGRDVELEIAGTPYPGYEWYERQLRELAGGDLEGHVTFSGYVYPVWPVLDRADIVLAPSLREPFGNAVVEAQLSQRPVIAAAAAGHLETVRDGETGLLTTPGDAAALADAVERLLDDSDMRGRLAVTGRERAVSEYSIDRYGRQIAALLVEMAARPRPQRKDPA